MKRQLNILSDSASIHGPLDVSISKQARCANQQSMTQGLLAAKGDQGSYDAMIQVIMQIGQKR